ncbi:MAG: hypothetical protein GY839_01455 [candidate division Zixibacteria bacterium]|nr:hypothetical protein [candidate division Zixibacteria bacterium]
MKYKIAVTVILALTLLNCTSSDNKTATYDINDILIPEIGGFTRSDQLNIYPADSLYNYIDGAAEEFIGYGVTQVASAEYRKGDFIYAVDIYEFADPLGAFGIYARRRLPTDRFIDLGAEALIGSGYVYYLKDRFFATINSYGEDLPDLTSLNNFAEALDHYIPGTAVDLEPYAVFPAKRLIDHSQRFWPHGFDNYAVPESCFSADYKRGNAVCRLFYSLNRTNTEYETFKTLIQRRGRVMTHMAGFGGNSIYAITDDDGKILLGYSNEIIFGVMAVSNDFWAKALCEAMFENLGLEM